MSQNNSTRAVHAGENPRKENNAITTPIVQTSTYTFENTAAVVEFVREKTYLRENGCDFSGLREEYGRYGNPTMNTAEQKLAALEGAEDAVLFPTGMNAITTTLLALLSAGDHVVAMRDCYRRTREFATDVLPRWGIESTLVSVGDKSALEAAIQPNTKLIFGESPTNPYLRVMDFEHLSALTKDKGILTAVDATFATPLNMQPLAMGIDLVMHSATKYLGGHNDLLAGVVAGKRALVKQLRDARGLFGGMGSPNDAYLLLRGLKTLALRVNQQNASALRIATFLENHPAIERVYYPGLPSHPDHAVAARQMQGFGGVVSFEVAGGKEATSAFVDALQIPYIGPTLGGVESIVQQQALFISIKEEERRESGISDSLVRYAVGIEDCDDLLADLQQALAVALKKEAR